MYPSLTTFPGDAFAEFDALRRQLTSLLGDWPSSIRAAARGSFPALNMGTTDTAVEIYAFAPGLNPASIDVHVDKGLLSIAGERAGTAPQESADTHFYARERFTGSFKRVVSLPEDVDASRIEATYRNGVLRIAIPKRAPTKPRRIEIQGQDQLEHKQ